MKIKYIRKNKISDLECDRKFTENKEYKVLADYRERCSGQKIPDAGLVIINDKNEKVMVFLYDFKITCNEKGDTYIYKK